MNLNDVQLPDGFEECNCVAPGKHGEAGRVLVIQWNGSKVVIEEKDVGAFLHTLMLGVEIMDQVQRQKN